MKSKEANCADDIRVVSSEEAERSVGVHALGQEGSCNFEENWKKMNRGKKIRQVRGPEHPRPCRLLQDLDFDTE